MFACKLAVNTNERRQRMDIRKAELGDSDKISELVYKAFKNYELFNIPSNHSSKISALQEIFKLNTIAYINEKSCYVCFEDGDLIGTFNLINLQNSSVTIFDYLKAGAFVSLFKINMLTTSKILKNIIKADSILNEYKPKYWYLDTLVISPQKQGSGFGSQIITQIKKMIQNKSKQSNLRLITNSNVNAKFYIKNGFSITKKETFTMKENKITTWSFLYQDTII
ncbi:GNAT family N-acetyltransferase [Leuconostoc carnosum]|nr:GNAT family N-acetyltransferase [Leuconostoc carnosum]QEA32785.1 GNAT family N-acetyltransferase [Leuconostoc carnosum]